MFLNRHLLLSITIASVAAFLLSLSALAEIASDKDAKEELRKKLWIWIILLLAGFGGLCFVGIMAFTGGISWK